MKIVLAAGESAGVQMLRVLARSGHSVVGVAADAPEAGTAGSSAWNVAQQLGYETWPGKRLKDANFAEYLRAQGVDLLLNMHSLHLIHEAVLAAPKLGAFNLHPGPLPRYAGLNPVSWAIFQGEKQHGVTVHRMDPGVDTGPIVYQSLFPIEVNESALSLSLKCVREGLELVSRLLQAAESGPDAIPQTPQDLSKREYFGREIPEDGKLCWAWPAQKVINFVRACDYFPFSSPWGHPQTRLGVQEFALVKANRTGRQCQAAPGTVGDCDNSGVYVACCDEWILASKLRIEGRYLPAVDFLRSGDQLKGVYDARGCKESDRAVRDSFFGDARGSSVVRDRSV